MTLRYSLGLAVLLACAATAIAVTTRPVQAQIPVVDPLNLVQTTENATTTGEIVSVVQRITAQWEAVNAILRDTDRYRTPEIAPSMPSADGLPQALAFVRMIRDGDARDENYRSAITTLPPLEPFLDKMDGLSRESRREIEAAYGSIQIMDTVIPRAGHHNAELARYVRMTEAIAALVDDITSGRNAKHYLTARLDTTAGAMSLLNRQAQQETIRSAHELELRIARNIPWRNDAANAVNFQMEALTRGVPAAEAFMRGTDIALENWRLN